MENTKLEPTGLRRIDPIILAYVAGYFDGEGCVSAYIVKKGSLISSLSMSNCYPGILNQLRGFWGGGVYTPKRRKGFRTEHQWRVTGENSRQMARDILPYLVEKRRQVQLFLYLYETKPRSAARQLLVDEIKALKHINYDDLTHRR